MSIVLANTSPTTLPANVAPASPPVLSPGEEKLAMVVVAVWLLVAVVIAIRLRAFSKRSVVGPERLGFDESAWGLFTIACAGLCICRPIATFVNDASHHSPAVKPLILTAVVESVLFLLVVGASAICRRDGIARLGLRLGQLPKGILIGIVGLFVLFPAVTVVDQIVGLILTWANLPPPKPHPVLEDLAHTRDPRMILLAVVVAVVVAPCCEELLFRGVMQTLLARFFHWVGMRERFEQPTMLPALDSNNPVSSIEARPNIRPMPTGRGARWIAIVITAAVFAQVHGEPAFMAPLFLLAIGLGYIYERTGNLWATITMHALFNACQIALFVSVAADYK